MIKKANPPPEAEPRLRLSADIDSDEFARIRAAVLALCRARERQAHRRSMGAVMKRLPKPHRKGMLIVGLIALCGTLVGLLFTINGGLLYQGYRLDYIFIAYFVVLTALAYWFKRQEYRLKRRQVAFLGWLARQTTRRLLSSAAKSVPFGAEYQVFDDEIAYARIIDGVSNRRWKRRLCGVRMEGDGFTLLFKKDTSRDPYGILLNPPSAEFSQQLDRLGLRRMSLHDQLL
ncbi:hypothetical protein [Duganella sp. P38]|uniref:hypothetical protein n=1 Tax=Duganella sp. P38 TaxID=3423949 RepID=UPI003D7BDE4E